MPKKPSIIDTPDYQNACALIALHADASNRLAGLIANLEEELMAVRDTYRKQHDELAAEIEKAEHSIAELCRRNPQWFEKAKSIKTTHGVAKRTEGTALEINNDALTVRLIKKHRADEASTLIRTEEKPNKDTLSALTDDELADIGVERKKSVSFKVTPAKTDLGKPEPKSKSAA